MPRPNSSTAPAPAPATASTTNATGDGKAPVQTFRHRNIKAAIWQNETQKDGLPFFNVTITRSYRDESGEWHDTQSFGYDDLTHVAKLMYDAHSFISAERAKLAEAARGGTARPSRS